LKTRINRSILEIIKGDITDLAVDAIVNAANVSLQMGGGVAGAILRKGGSKIQMECDNLAPIKTGETAITNSGKLKVKKIIHAVGPIYGSGNEEIMLKNAVLNSLKCAAVNNLKTIAFPAISAGIYGFPKEKCAEILLQTTINFLEKDNKLDKVIFCLYNNELFNIFKKKLITLLAY
jgi:O-acetyl-ADP-ribose deacetylase (regulator of RNase III)